MIFIPVLFLNNITKTHELLSIQLNQNKDNDSLPPFFFFNLSSYGTFFFLFLIVKNLGSDASKIKGACPKKHSVKIVTK